MTYINLVVLHVQPDGIARPYCEKHGAMLAVNRECTLYRCPECGVGIDVSQLNQYITDAMANLLEYGKTVK